MNDDGTIQCLYAETPISFIPTTAMCIRVYEASSYNDALNEYGNDVEAQMVIESILNDES